MNKILLTIAILFVSVFSFAKQDVYTAFASNKAIKGYDTVAYFTQNKAVEGHKDFSFEWNDATWLFASEENLNLFKSEPEKYAPQYGGYCAFAMAKGKKVKINPNNFTILDGKLYLNYSTKVQDQWLDNTQGFIESADKVWSNFAE